MSQSRASLIVAIVLLLLPVLYVRSYLALVVPGGFRDDQDWDGRTWVYPNRHYRIERLDGFFWPLEQVDRKMRPGAWRPPLETGGKISLEFREWREETDSEANSRREIEETLCVLGTDPQALPVPIAGAGSAAPLNRPAPQEAKIEFGISAACLSRRVKSAVDLREQR